MKRLRQQVDDLWQRFWLHQFRNLCPPPTPWARLVMAWEDAKREIGEALAPAVADLLCLLEYEEAKEWQKRRAARKEDGE